MYLSTIIIKNTRRAALLLISLFIASTIRAQAKVEYPVKMYDFGTIAQSCDSVSCNFEVTNIGNEPLVIEGVYVRCGCVSATHSTYPIKPGEKGYVTATLYPQGQENTVLKSIYVYTNTFPRKNVLRVKALVSPTTKETSNEKQ